MRKLLTAAAALVLMGAAAVGIIAARGSGEAPPNGAAAQTGQAVDSARTSQEVTSMSAWVTEREMRTSQERGDENGVWVVGFFFRPDSECTKRGGSV